MVDQSETAGMVADFLDDLLLRIGGLSARVDELGASGELTPEMDREISARLCLLRAWLWMLRESVDPSGAPLLGIKRSAKEMATRMAGSGIPSDAIRSAFDDLVGRTSWALPEAQRAAFVRLISEALDEVLGGSVAVAPA